MSLPGRVVLIVMLLNCLAVAGSLALGIGRARQAVRAETASALDAAELVLRGGPASRLTALDIRHVRVSVAGEAAPVRARPKAAPGWFEALVGMEDVTRLVRVDGRVVTIAAHAGDEVAEAWGELTGWLMVATAALPLTALAVSVAVTRALAPLSGFGRALDAMAREEPGGAVPAAGTPELEAVSVRIAALDAGLIAERRRNSELSRALVELQDAERAGIAREVHDELGPLLFAVGVDAHALLRAAESTRLDRADVRARARSIGELVGEIRALSRRILGRLRPMALDHLPLSAVLEDLFGEVRTRHSEVTLEATTTGDLDALGPSLTPTLYRVVQEAVLNALRHGRPSRVLVDISASAREIRVVVADDGPGVGEAAPAGHGLLGMRERVAALGGTVRIGTSELGGASVEAVLPRTVVPLTEAA